MFPEKHCSAIEELFTVEHQAIPAGDAADCADTAARRPQELPIWGGATASSLSGLRADQLDDISGGGLPSDFACAPHLPPCPHSLIGDVLGLLNRDLDLIVA
jgi:hypothetical protein